MKLSLHYYRFHSESQAEEIRPSLIPYYDLTIVLSGKLLYRVNHKEITVREGGCLLMPPGSKRERFALAEKTTYVSFNFKTDEEIPLPLTMEDAVGDEVRLMIYACNEIDRGSGAYAARCFEDMTSAILNALSAFISHRENSALTAEILRYIHERYREPLSLKRIADELAYSPTYCDAVFKRDVGMPIVRYIIDYRISKVKEFLIENILSLREIAERTGFGEGNYLSRQFRQRTGMSPLRFRKQFNR